jgi:hypothetical protein
MEVVASPWISLPGACTAARRTCSAHTAARTRHVTGTVQLRRIASPEFCSKYAQAGVGDKLYLVAVARVRRPVAAGPAPPPLHPSMLERLPWLPHCPQRSITFRMQLSGPLLGVVVRSHLP